MIITCEKCSTKFNFDESLLKENGSKVQCCLCKHIFAAYPPSGENKNESRLEPNDKSVSAEFKKSREPRHEAENGSKEGTGVIPPHEDLGSGDEPEFEDSLDFDNEEDFELDFDFDDEFESEKEFESEDLDSETDFETNTGEDSAGDDSTEFDFFSDEDLNPVDNLETDFDKNFDSKSDFDFENQDFTNEIENGDLSSGENFELDLGFENVDDSADDFEFDELKQGSAGDKFKNDEISMDEETLELDLSEFNAENTEQSESLSVHEDPEETLSHEEAELEIMEDEQSLLDAATNIGTYSSDSVLTDSTLSDSKLSDSKLSDSTSPDSPEISLDTKQENIPEHEESELSTLNAMPGDFENEEEFKKPVKRLGKSVFVVLFLAIIILAGYSISIMKGINIPYISNVKIPFLTQYLTPKPIAKPSSVNVIPDRKSINGRFVTNSSAGTLFVITGRIINKSPIPCSHVKVTGTLITKDKIKVKNKIVFCGNLIPEDKLRTLKMNDINIILARKTGSNNSNVDIAPGRSIPFMIVFSSLPDNLQNFTVNVAGFDQIKK